MRFILKYMLLEYIQINVFYLKVSFKWIISDV